MSAYTIKLQRMSKERIEEVKKLAKQEISFSFRFTTNRQNYALGSVNFLPTKKARKFSEEQVKEILEFFDRHNLCHSQLESWKLQGTKIFLSSFWQGLSYIYEKA